MIEQRLGESDKDYEARKKRVRRTRQGVDFGLAHAGGGGGIGNPGPIPNSCITQGSDGTGYGYNSSVPYGDIRPNLTNFNSQFIYSNYWMADGTFIMQFGQLGNEPLIDTPNIFIYINDTLLQYVWDSVELRYEANNLTLATQLINDYVESEIICYTALPVPNKFISYNFSLFRNGVDTYYRNNTAMRPHFNAPAQASNHVWLNGTDQSVDLPIIDDPVNSYATYYDVDTKAFKNIGGKELVINGDFTTDSDWVKGTGWTIADGKASVTGVSGSNLSQTGLLKPGITYNITFDVLDYVQGTINCSCNDGSYITIFPITAGGAYNVTYTVPAGVNETLHFRTTGSLPQASIDNVSVKEVLLIGTTYTMTDSFSSYFTTDVPVTEADRGYLTSNPEALYAMWFGEPVVGLSFSKANMINFVPGTEGLIAGDTLTDLSDSSTMLIANYTDACRTTYTNSNFGASNFALVQDSSGRVTSMGLANTQNFPPYDDGRYASTGFKPNIARYSIEETVTGELQDFGSEEVVNGTFDTDTDWSKGVGWTISGGTLNNDGSTSGSNTAQDNVVLASREYIVTGEISNMPTGEMKISLYDGIWVNITISSEGVFTESFTTGVGSNGRLYIADSGGNPFTIDNVSIKELTTKSYRTEVRLLTVEDDGL